MWDTITHHLPRSELPKMMVRVVVVSGIEYTTKSNHFLMIMIIGLSTRHSIGFRCASLVVVCVCVCVVLGGGDQSCFKL